MLRHEGLTKIRVSMLDRCQEVENLMMPKPNIADVDDGTTFVFSG